MLNTKHELGINMRWAGLLALLALLLFAACDTTPATPAPPTPTVVVPTVTADANEGCRDPQPPASASFHAEPNATRTPIIGRYKPKINISRKDYDAALAKWQATGIKNYEIEVEPSGYMMGGDLILQVKENGDIFVVEDPFNRGIQTPTLSTNPEFHQENTVAGLFAHVDLILTNGLCESVGVWAFPISYIVIFDRDLGYPTVIKRNASSPAHWDKEGLYSSAPAHSSYTFRVKRLDKLILTPTP